MVYKHNKYIINPMEKNHILNNPNLMSLIYPHSKIQRLNILQI